MILTPLYVALLGWVPITLALFATLTPRRAVVASCLGATLFLPAASLEIPGLPGELTRYSAFSLATLIGIIVFDARRFGTLRLRWFDVPAIGYLLSPVITSVTNGLGVYDGLSNVYESAMMIGFPYLFGRLYASGEHAMRDIALGIALAGLLYAPLCLWEVRMSPQLHSTIYGYQPMRFLMFRRMGGFRPVGFTDSPLLLSMFMAAATITLVWLTAQKKRLVLFGIPLGWMVPLMLVVVVTTKSFASITVTILAISLLFFARRFRASLPVLIVLSVIISYPVLRSTQVLEGDTVISMVEPIFPDERVESLNYRLVNEDLFIARALEQPWFGWGGYGRNRTEATGSIDGLWIVTLGTRGFVSLFFLGMLYAVPVWLFLRRCPARTWGRPEVAPAAALALVVTMYWLDCLSNGFINQTFFLSMGALSGHYGMVRRRVGQPAPAAPADSEPVDPGFDDLSAPDPEPVGARMSDLIGGRRHGTR